MIMTSALSAVTPAAPSIFDLAIKGGVMMIPIALCSIAVLAVVAERWSVLRPSKVIPPKFRDVFNKATSTGGAAGLETLRQLVATPQNAAARLIAAGVAKLGHSHEFIEKHLAAAGEHEVYVLRRRTRILSVVAALAPLLGLTGTIFGMIRSFQTVAASGENLGKAELLAAGIYEAMITTAAGLLVAMPTIVFAHWFAGKIERLTRDIDGIAVQFMEAFVIEAATPNHTSDTTPVLLEHTGTSGVQPKPALVVAEMGEG